MFSGIIEAVGIVISHQVSQICSRLEIEAPWTDLTIGESIAVNGVCLTLLESSRAHQLHFDVSSETLRCTQLGELAKGARVNLERAMRLNQRNSGHYVTGHVDTTAHISSVENSGEYITMEIAGFTADEMRYLVAKGSIAINGVSLTINQVKENAISVMLIPHTLSHTTFDGAIVGLRVNIEFDYLARIVVHQLGFLQESTILSSFVKQSEV